MFLISVVHTRERGIDGVEIELLLLLLYTLYHTPGDTVNACRTQSVYRARCSRRQPWGSEPAHTLGGRRTRFGRSSL